MNRCITVLQKFGDFHPLSPTCNEVHKFSEINLLTSLWTITDHHPKSPNNMAFRHLYGHYADALNRKNRHYSSMSISGKNTALVTGADRSCVKDKDWEPSPLALMEIEAE